MVAFFGAILKQCNDIGYTAEESTRIAAKENTAAKGPLRTWNDQTVQHAKKLGELLF